MESKRVGEVKKTKLTGRPKMEMNPREPSRDRNGRSRESRARSRRRSGNWA